jgi:hypothetical protein
VAPDTSSGSAILILSLERLSHLFVPGTFSPIERLIDLLINDRIILSKQYE